MMLFVGSCCPLLAAAVQTFNTNHILTPSFSTDPLQVFGGLEWEVGCTLYRSQG